jgi:hypothetical protein
LRAVSELTRRPMRLTRRGNVERKKTFPVFSAKNPQVNREFECTSCAGLAFPHSVQQRGGGSESFREFESRHSLRWTRFLIP